MKRTFKATKDGMIVTFELKLEPIEADNFGVVSMESAGMKITTEL